MPKRPRWRNFRNLAPGLATSDAKKDEPKDKKDSGSFVRSAGHPAMAKEGDKQA